MEINGVYQCAILKYEDRKIFLLSDLHTEVKKPNQLDLIVSLFSGPEKFVLYFESDSEIRPYIPNNQLEFITILRGPLTDLIDYIGKRPRNEQYFESIPFDFRDPVESKNIDMGFPFRGLYANIRSLQDVVNITDRKIIERIRFGPWQDVIKQYINDKNEDFLSLYQDEFDALIRKSRLTREEKDKVKFCVRDQYSHLIDIWVINHWSQQDNQNTLIFAGSGHTIYMTDFLISIQAEILFELDDNENLAPVKIPKLW